MVVRDSVSRPVSFDVRHPASRPHVAHAGVVTAIVAVYVALATAMMMTKRPWVDEAWFATPALHLLRDGVMGTTNIETAGTWLAGIEHHTYWMMPLHFIVQAAWYGVTGFGVAQMRSLSMVFGLVTLLSWGFITGRVSGSRLAGMLAMGLLATDFIFIRGATDGRMDVMCGSLAAASFAAYLALRTSRLRLAVFTASTLAAASLLTHPNGILAAGGLATLALTFDRRRLRAGHVAIAAVPYVVGLGAWGAYIMEAPALFVAQFGGNASGRLTGIRSLFEHVANAYGPAFGLTAHWAGPVVHLRVLILLAYLAGVAGLVFTADLRRQPGARVLAVLACVYVLLMSFIGSPNAHDYLVHIVPIYLACVATVVAWHWERRRPARVLAAGAAAALVLLQTGGIAMRVRLDPYARDYRPAMAFLDRRVPPGALVMGSAELGFHRGFTSSLIDDTRLGYLSGRHPDFIVVEERYRQWFDTLLDNEPEAKRHVHAMLRDDYVSVYDQPPYAIYERRPPRQEPLAARSDARVR